MEKASSLLELSRLDSQAFVNSQTAIEISEEEAVRNETSVSLE